MTRALSVLLSLALGSALSAEDFRPFANFLLNSHVKVTAERVTPIPMKPIVFHVATDGVRVRITAEGDEEASSTFEIYRSDGIGRPRRGEARLEVLPGIQAMSKSGGVLRHLRLTRESLTITTFPGVSDYTIITQALAMAASPPPAGPSETTSQALEKSASSAKPAVALPIAEAAQDMRAAATRPPQTRAYPLLLLLSTAMAGLFCFMYITKPVISLAPPPVTLSSVTPAKPLPIPEQPATDQPLGSAEKSAAAPSLTTPEKPVAALAGMLPNPERLPGDPDTSPAPHADGRQTPPVPSSAPTFEETNLHIQHVLSAATPDGDVSRIVLNVPVLYQSRRLRWTASEVAESRELLKRLGTYQENSRALRAEGSQLLAAWNHLVELSIPTSVLRADSPSLPANQEQAELSQHPAGLDTTESIKIQPADK